MSMKYIQFNGFSLVEVVISAALIATTLGALFAVASMTQRLTILGQDRLIATELAKEGIEATRQIRDANFIGSCNQTPDCSEWWSGLVAPGGNNGQVFKLTSAANGFSLTVPKSSTCAEEITQSLDQNGQHTQDFCRRIFIEPVPTNSAIAKHAVRIRSQVAWLGFGRNKYKPYENGANSSVSDENVCTSQEWCTEQVTILTDWRPSL